MQREVPATKLTFVAGAIAKLGPVIWDEHENPHDPLRAVSLSVDAHVSR